MPHHVETDVTVQRFGYAGDSSGRKLQFPRVESHHVEGRSGSVVYGAVDALFDGLEGRLDTLRWTADAVSFGGALLRDDGGRVDIAVERIEMPRGIMLTRADRGVEVVSPHVSLSEMRLTVKGPFGGGSREEVPVVSPAPEPKELRQDKLRFLDSLSGRIYFTVKVVLDLPVLGQRTLDQQLKLAIQEGSLDFRALDDSLDWLEGAFLDIKHDNDKLALTWKVPIVGSSRELVTWVLDRDASALASFGRVPVRSLADFRFPRRERDKQNGGGEKKKGSILQAFSLDAIDIALSLMAPRSLEAAGGVIMFGGDDQPGMLDFKVTGEIHNHGPAAVRGAIGSIDTTIKDIHIGPALLAADRLHFDGLDELEVTFDGFSPTSVTVVVHRVTATNLSLQLGGGRT